MTEDRRRILDIVREVTRASNDDIEQTNQFDRLEGWDSLMQLNLVLAIEHEFAIQFDVEEITTITSIDTASALVAAKTQPVHAPWQPTGTNGGQRNEQCSDRGQMPQASKDKHNTSRSRP